VKYLHCTLSSRFGLIVFLFRKHGTPSIINVPRRSRGSMAIVKPRGRDRNSLQNYTFSEASARCEEAIPNRLNTHYRMYDILFGCYTLDMGLEAGYLVRSQPLENTAHDVKNAWAWDMRWPIILRTSVCSLTADYPSGKFTKSYQSCSLKELLPVLLAYTEDV
jgi:hypothetical protein